MVACLGAPSGIEPATPAKKAKICQNNARLRVKEVKVQLAIDVAIETRCPLEPGTGGRGNFLGADGVTDGGIHFLGRWHRFPLTFL